MRGAADMAILLGCALVAVSCSTRLQPVAVIDVTEAVPMWYEDAEGRHVAPIGSLYQMYGDQLVAIIGFRSLANTPPALVSDPRMGLEPPSVYQFYVRMRGEVPPVSDSKYSVAGRIVKSESRYHLQVISWRKLTTSSQQNMDS